MNVFAFANTVTIIITIVTFIINLVQAWLEDRFRQVQRLTCSRVQVGFQIDHKHFGNYKLCRPSPLGLWSKAGYLCVHHYTGTRTMATHRRWRNGSTQSIGRSGIVSIVNIAHISQHCRHRRWCTKINIYEVSASRSFPKSARVFSSWLIFLHKVPESWRNKSNSQPLGNLKPPQTHLIRINQWNAFEPY